MLSKKTLVIVFILIMVVILVTQTGTPAVIVGYNCDERFVDFTISGDVLLDKFGDECAIWLSALTENSPNFFRVLHGQERLDAQQEKVPINIMYQITPGYSCSQSIKSNFTQSNGLFADAGKRVYFCSGYVGA